MKTDSSPGPWRTWSWVPSLYFCEAIPYVAVVALSVVMYKRLGYANFFVWVCVATLPSIAATAWLKVDQSFGRRQERGQGD